MPAFLSPQDDRDEQGGRFYAVLGRLNQPQPHLTLRLGLYGHWLPLDPATLFTDIIPFAPAPPPDEAWQVGPSTKEPDSESGSFLSRFLPGRWTV
jgi:hypothetical protein